MCHMKLLCLAESGRRHLAHQSRAATRFIRSGFIAEVVANRVAPQWKSEGSSPYRGGYYAADDGARDHQVLSFQRALVAYDRFR